MYRRLPPPRTVLATFLLATGSPALSGSAFAETTPPQPAAAQPTLPSAAQAAPPKPGSPVVEEMVQNKPPLTVRKRAARHVTSHTQRWVRRHGRGPAIARPALAGVELVAPLPPPLEPPHIVVPTPAFPLDALAAAYLTPPPPIICHSTRRDPSQPDPHLYKENPVVCEPDNP